LKAPNKDDGIGSRQTPDHYWQSGSPDYELKFGVLGKLLDLIFVRRSYEKRMGELLGELKE